ncbi:MAG: SCO family protein, partial [Bacteroidota bacterium]
MKQTLKTSIHFLLISVFLFMITSCHSGPERALPILGPKELSRKVVDGKEVPDTLYHTIKSFEFINQEGKLISETTFKDKIYVCDFIFTTCPSICPLMSKQMQRVQQAFAEEDEVYFLSHTVDPVKDSVPVLKNYSERYQANNEKWHFVTGDKEELYEMGLKNYLVSMDENEVAPGGFLH